MIAQIEAVFENGVLRPLGAVPLAERDRVTVTISGPDEASFSLSEEQWAAFTDALDSPARVVPVLRSLLTAPGAFDVPA